MAELYFCAMDNSASAHLIPLSVLDLAPILEGKTIADSFNNTLDLALHTESLNYHRFWIAEHHNMESIASSATSILIGYVANGTKKIKVGSGGIMLPNHAPLVIAEQFGTLGTLFPHRIELGLGRAPGTDQLTAMALRRDRYSAAMNFEENILELQRYFSPENKSAKVRAIPGEGVDVPFWILGSSTDSAYLSARLGLPYAFASHFAPDELLNALEIYRESFTPSAALQKPKTMACVNVIAADTVAEAEFLSTSFLQLARGIITGERKPLPPPVKNIDDFVSAMERFAINQRMRYTFIGDKNKVRQQLLEFRRATSVDELMVVSHIYDHEARKRSYSILSEALS
jgi:luciferase family oxidoreductase group 1